MTSQAPPKSYIVDRASLPAAFPTHRMDAEFWEALGRTVATFGFLEEVLGKAIFAMTATTPMPSDPAKQQAAFEKWLPTLVGAISEPLGGRIDRFGKAVRLNKKATTTNPKELLKDLKAAAELRNVLCHGSWRAPDTHGRSTPLYVTKKLKQFVTPIDVAYLNQAQVSVAESACHVINTVTHMGYQFPGSSGPGVPVGGPA